MNASKFYLDLLTKEHAKREKIVEKELLKVLEKIPKRNIPLRKREISRWNKRNVSGTLVEVILKSGIRFEGGRNYVYGPTMGKVPIGSYAFIISKYPTKDTPVITIQKIDNGKLHSCEYVNAEEIASLKIIGTGIFDLV